MKSGAMGFRWSAWTGPGLCEILDGLVVVLGSSVLLEILVDVDGWRKTKFD